MRSFAEYVEWIGLVVDGAGVGIIVLGLLGASTRFVFLGVRQTPTANTARS